MYRRGLAGWIAVVAACSDPEPIEQAELGEVCGAKGTFRVLELPVDQTLRSTRYVGNRALHNIGPIAPNMPTNALWATGPCGESPVRVAEDLDYTFIEEMWPAVILGCSRSGDVLSFDPHGVKPQNVVLAGVGEEEGVCGLRWTAYGVLAIKGHDDEFGALQLHPYPDDPWSEAPAPIVLLDVVRTRVPNSPYDSLFSVLYLDSEFALALTPDDRLVRVDLADGEVSTAQYNVHEFTVSNDGRYMLWQDATVTRDEPLFPEGALFLQDTQQGGHHLLGTGALAWSPSALWWGDRGVVLLRLGYFGAPQRAFLLPGLELFNVPGDVDLVRPLADDRWLVASLVNDYYELFDVRTGARTRLFSREGEILRVDDVAADLHVVPKNTGAFTEGPLWQVPLDGSTPTRHARRVTSRYRRLGDGRILSPLGVNDAGLGRLVLIDPETETELQIDDRVGAYSLDVSRFDDEGIVRYSVSDGARSGVYLARLPPRE